MTLAEVRREQFPALAEKTFLDDVAREAALIERLLDERILVSHRYTSGVGGVRVSCHFFNTMDDIARLLDVAGAWLTSSSRTR